MSSGPTWSDGSNSRRGSLSRRAPASRPGKTRVAAAVSLLTASTAMSTAAPSARAAEPEPTAPETGQEPFSPAMAPLGIETENASIRFGLLLQPQYQLLGDNSLTGDAEDLYLRRARFLVGGSLFGVVDYYFATDYPDAFLSRAAVGSPSVKYTPALSIQDAFLTARPFGEVVMLDAGYFLPPMARNALQGAGTLFGWDYFRYTFQHDLAFGSPQNLNPPTTPAGRDAGVQLRGLLLGGLVEYRIGAFQGLREQKTTSATGAQNDFRITSRLQVNLLDPEPGFFRAGTFFGDKSIASVGVSYDFQNSFSKDYLYVAADAFVDLPLGPGALTAQVNVAHWNGNDFIPAVAALNQVGILLQEQTAVMAEVGYTIFALRLSPIVRFERVGLESPHLPPQTRYAGGLAFWPFGHNLNVKAFYTRIQQEAPEGSPPFHGANQINVQGQLFYY